jgi:hypothetical protein
LAPLASTASRDTLSRGIGASVRKIEKNATKTRHVDNPRQRRWGTPASVGGEPGGTSAPIHGLRYLFSALRREGLIADELVLQLATFLRSLELFLELIVLTPRTLTANQVRHGGKQGTDNPEHSRIHSSTCPALTSLPRSFSGPKIKTHVKKRLAEQALIVF